MKKNISINISGIIFHIEEDGYDQLKQYLESINRYFSSFDDSLEIIADIEGRIAEIFLTELKDGKQVITKEDVEKLIATMGSIEDFQAAEEESSYIIESTEKEKKEERSDQKEEPKEEYAFSRKLYRDNRRKILGGVLAGIAHYFNVDPLWIRLFYLLLFFGISILPSIGGFLFIAYIVMWIIIPGSDELEETRKIKKMYRDPDHKVLGGVCSGAAAYFGIDVVIVRLLFFISIFLGGTGLILYIILWIILPEARTITDRLEMQGEPLTLKNIEAGIKKSLNIKEDEENVFIKILLFPFRLIASLIDFLSKSSGPLLRFLGEVARVLAGLILLLTGIILIIALVITMGVLLGVITNYGWLQVDNLPVEILSYDIGILSGIALFLALFIPFLGLSVAGAAVLMKRSLVNPTAGWSMLGLWFISIIILSFVIPSKIHDFNMEGQFKKEDTWNLQDKVLVLDYKEVPGIHNLDYDQVELNIRSHYDSSVRLVQYYVARGGDRTEAIENAKGIEYNVSLQDSTLTFDSDFSLGEEVPFRVQKVELVLYLPLGQQFVMDDQLKWLFGRFMYRNGYSNYDIESNVWEFNQDGLHCVTCPEEPEDFFEEETDRKESFNKSDIRGYFKMYENLDSFSSVQLRGSFEVYIQEDNTFEVIVNGDEDLVKEIEIDENAGVLYLENDKDIERHKIKIYLSMPELKSIDIEARSTAFVEGFSENKVDIQIDDGGSAEMNIDARYLSVELSDASKLILEGDGKRIDANISGASRLMAFEYEVDKIVIDIRTNSSARLNADENITVNVSDNSLVRYKGDAVVEIENKTDNSKVTREK